MNEYWRPFNSPNDNNGLEINKADGIYLETKNGVNLLDTYSGLWNMPFGNSDHEIIEEIKKQLDQLIYINPLMMENKLQVEVSKMLCNLMHESISKIIYTCTGSEAIELAIKISRKYQNLRNSRKRSIAVIEQSYHGSYYGAMAATNYESEFKEGYGPMLEGFIKIPIPFCRCCKQNQMSDLCLNKIIIALNEQLEKNKDTLCAILIESIIASGGVIKYPQKYIDTLREFCMNNDVLFICDEVAVGFGRTGKMFGYEHYNLQPDVITTSKAINNGYLPMGAVAVSEKIAIEFEKKNEIIYHLSTQNANLLCLAATKAMINKMQSKTILKEIQKKSEYFNECFSKILVQIPKIHDIRMVGLMIAIDLINENNKPIEIKQLQSIKYRILKQGYIVGLSYIKNITSSLLLFPSYIMKKTEIKTLTTAIMQAILDNNI